MAKDSLTIRRADPRLHVMMFLQYAVAGVYIPIAARFLSAEPGGGGLGFTDGQIGMIMAGAGAIGAVTAPFLGGQVADRYFATQRCLGALLVAAGVVKLIMAHQQTYWAWLWLSVLGAVAYSPTTALSNPLAMAHMADPKRQFPGVRVWGTVAWVAVAWAFPMIWLQTDLRLQWLPPFFAGELLPDAPARMIDSVKVSGVLAIAYGLFSWFCLPHTPPKRDAVEKLAFAKAFGLLRRRSLTVLVAAALLLGVIHSLYFLQTSKFLAARGLADNYLMPAMSIGQISEVAVMAFLGALLGRLGFRPVLLLGAFSYVLRYLIFGTEGLPLSVLVASQFLHGLCFACVAVASYIYIDRAAPEDVRHSMQTVFALVVSGVGSLIAGPFNGLLARWCTPPGGVLDYSRFWYAAAGVGVVALVLLALLFRDETASAPDGER